MPRQSRIDAPGALHHIIARGIERRNIFQDDKDRDHFVKRLGKVLIETGTPCYAWVLIPNHFHLLLRTGRVSISTVMRKLLTGYAVCYNKRHQRHGHLFQNRYKSILCQDDLYFKELVRYIHLNPLRAGLVKDFKGLNCFKYSGHSAVLGNINLEGYNSNSVLESFSSTISLARKNYLAFIIDGLNQGKREDLIGGGLIRSNGGWENVKALRKTGDFQKSDERILGDSEFVENLLFESNERINRKQGLALKGINLKTLLNHVSTVFKIDIQKLYRPGKERLIVNAKSLVCYWANKELDISMTDLSKEFGVSVTTISKAVKRGESLSQEKGYMISEVKKFKSLERPPFLEFDGFKKEAGLIKI